MSFISLVALATATATPAPPAPPAPPLVTVTVSTPSAKSKSASSEAAKAADQAASMSMYADMAVKALDRILPPQADPDPARLALARITMDGFMPAGSYDRMMNAMTDKLMGDVYERVMGMTGTEMSNAIGLPVVTGPDAALTFRQQATKDDPMFDARIRAYVGAFKEDTKVSMRIMEPKVREGMARAMARRFSAAQLTDLNRFFATDTGRAFGQDMMMLWIDGDVYRGMFAAMPDLMRTMPDSAKRMAAIDAQYPWPKKKVEPAKPSPTRKKSKK